MIQEDYVTFKQAKLLKEKEFPWDACVTMYNYNGEDTSIFSSVNKGEYSKPTLSLVQKWLREEKEIFVCVGPEYHIEPDKRGIDYARRDFRVWTYFISTLHGFMDTTLVEAGNEYNTYEDALSAAIDKALELI